MGLTPEQLAMRSTGMGGSDIGAALGWCQYRSPFDVFREKKGIATNEENYRMWWGTELEAFVLTTLEKRPHYFVPATPAPELLYPSKRFGTLRHPTEPWVFASPDAVAMVDGRPLLLEVKCPAVKGAEGWGAAGTSEVPTKFAAQGLWTANVLRALGWAIEEIWVLALFGNREPQRFVVPWDAGRAAWLVEQGRRFWFENVVANVPPEMREAA